MDLEKLQAKLDKQHKTRKKSADKSPWKFNMARVITKRDPIGTIMGSFIKERKMKKI